MKRASILLWIILFCLFRTYADVRMPAIFGDGMVLQRNEPITIWGWADADEHVTVRLNGQSASSTADGQGKWKLKLAPEKAGGPYELVVEGKSTITFSDVLVGEVWICSGQSNMEWVVKNSNNSKEEIANSNYPTIRHVKIPKAIAAVPLDDLSSKPVWQAAGPTTTGSFTAAGYYFARELSLALRVPIGLVNTTWGGTMSETWTSLEAFEGSEEFRNVVVDLKRVHRDSLAKTKKPNDYPTLLFNGMVNPLIPYTIKGVIWYQGEANTSRAYQYRQAFPLLIQDWRSHWQLGDFPFYFVQLASWKASGGNSDVGSTWAELREAQTLTLQLPNTGQAITTDIGDTEDIHPRNKQDVGKRLAALALHKTYSKKVPYTGPTYLSKRIVGNRAIVTFKNVSGGLQVKGSKTLEGFEIAGDDQKFKPAKAHIKGNKVILQAEGVANPIAIRYSWSDDPGTSNLFNGKGFPAAPFRTDNWPLVTRNKKYAIKK